MGKHEAILMFTWKTPVLQRYIHSYQPRTRYGIQRHSRCVHLLIWLAINQIQPIYSFTEPVQIIIGHNVKIIKFQLKLEVGISSSQKKLTQIMRYMWWVDVLLIYMDKKENPGNRGCQRQCQKKSNKRQGFQFPSYFTYKFDTLLLNQVHF